jgi:hypothetical protein
VDRAHPGHYPADAPRREPHRSGDHAHADELRDLDAAATLPIEGARYPEFLERLAGR